jgi:hypothetical protein
MDPLNPPAIHGEATAGRASSVRKKLSQLFSDIKSNTFDAMDLLHEAHINNYIRGWGFESTVDYAKSELGIKERKAQYLVRIKKVCLRVGVKRADYEPAGVSKLRYITTLDPEATFFNRETGENEPLDEHIARLIAEAPEMDPDEVEQEVKRLKGQTGDNEMVVRPFSCTRATWDKVIAVAHERCRRRLGSASRNDDGKAVEYSDGVVWEMICTEWLQDPNNNLDETEMADQIDDVPTEEVDQDYPVIDNIPMEE